jgi:hypothetical protein
VLAGAAVALLTGGWLLVDATSSLGKHPPRPARAEATVSARAAAERGALPMARSVPVRVRVPAIRLDAPVTRLGLAPDGTLDVPPPADPDLAGWYEHGVTPGERGTAVLAGHVDNESGPAVFYNLGALRRGMTVDVERADHSTAVFTIDAVAVYRKSAFPTRRVYRNTGRPELRLITCGGGYTPATGYLGNVVVYAHLTNPATGHSVPRASRPHRAAATPSASAPVIPSFPSAPSAVPSPAAGRVTQAPVANTAIVAATAVPGA